MSPAALAVEVHWAVGWQGFAEAVCEVGVQFALSDGMIVDYIEEAAESVVHRVNHGGSSVVAVDLVDPPVSVAFNDRGSVEEFSQQDAAGGAVNAAEAEHQSAERQDVLLGFEEELSGFGGGGCGGVFGDGFAVGLCENGRASGVGEQFGDEEGVEVFCAVEVDVSVGVSAAFAGTCAMDEGVGADEICEVCFDLVGVGDVASADGKRFGSKAFSGFLRMRAPGDIPAVLVKSARDFESDESASGDDGGAWARGVFGWERDRFREHGFPIEIEGAGEELSVQHLG